MKPERQYKPKPRLKYSEVRKVSWDALWHAVYVGGKSWDRVSETEALRIAKSL